MASQGPLSPATTVDDAIVGTVAWTNPNNSQASDNVRATSTVNNSTTHYLKATNFGFTIPAGVTIDGIVAEVERFGSLVTIKDSSIKAVQGGVISGTNQSTGSTWSGADTYKTFGSSTNLWGLSWTVDNINSSGFGVAISAFSTGFDQANIDHIRMTVYYSTTSMKDIIQPGLIPFAR